MSTNFNHTKVFVFPFINIPSFISLLFASSETSFISRPWRLVDGKVNRQVCKGMLEAVLYHIMSQPGLTHQALVEHYKDLLQPVAVQDLVQVFKSSSCYFMYQFFIFSFKCINISYTQTLEI